MHLSISINDLQTYVVKQLNNFYPDNNIVTSNQFNSVLEIAIDRVDYCFKNMVYERYNKNDQTILNHLYSDQYLVFLWFLANTIWKRKAGYRISHKTILSQQVTSFI